MRAASCRSLHRHFFRGGKVAAEVSHGTCDYVRFVPLLFFVLACECVCGCLCLCALISYPRIFLFFSLFAFCSQEFC